MSHIWDEAINMHAQITAHKEKWVKQKAQRTWATNKKNIEFIMNKMAV